MVCASSPTDTSNHHLAHQQQQPPSPTTTTTNKHSFGELAQTITDHIPNDPHYPTRTLLQLSQQNFKAVRNTRRNSNNTNTTTHPPTSASILPTPPIAIATVPIDVQATLPRQNGAIVGRAGGRACCATSSHCSATATTAAPDLNPQKRGSRPAATTRSISRKYPPPCPSPEETKRPSRSGTPSPPPEPRRYSGARRSYRGGCRGRDRGRGR